MRLTSASNRRRSAPASRWSRRPDNPLRWFLLFTALLAIYIGLQVGETGTSRSLRPKTGPAGLDTEGRRDMAKPRFLDPKFRCRRRPSPSAPPARHIPQALRGLARRDTEDLGGEPSSTPGLRARLDGLPDGHDPAYVIDKRFRSMCGHTHHSSA